MTGQNANWSQKHPILTGMLGSLLAVVIIAVLYALSKANGTPDSANGGNWIEVESAHFAQLVFAYSEAHPARLTFGLTVAVVVVLAAYRYTGRIWNVIRRRFQSRQMGVRAFLPRSTSDQRTASWVDCRRQIEASGKWLYMKGASGWETFGAPEAPLHETIKNFKGHARILLMSPWCDAMATRARSLHFNTASYRAHIRKAVTFLKKSKDAGISIELAFYRLDPEWKMIITEGDLWLQHYADGIHVEETPVYSFFANKTKTSLYYPFCTEFERDWARADKIDLNLSMEELKYCWVRPLQDF